MCRFQVLINELPVNSAQKYGHTVSLTTKPRKSRLEQTHLGSELSLGLVELHRGRRAPLLQLSPPPLASAVLSP